MAAKKYPVEYEMHDEMHDENDNAVDAWQIGPQVAGLLAEARAKDLRWAHINLPVTLGADTAAPGMTRVVAVLTRRITDGHYGFTLASVQYQGGEQLARARQVLTRHIRYKWCPSHGLIWQAPLELPQIHTCFAITINGHELRVDLLLYDPDSHSVRDAPRVYNGSVLVGEFGPYECDGFHVRSMYRGVNRAIEIARQILRDEIDETAREQSCQIDHENYDDHRSIKSRVFKEGDLVVWESESRAGAEPVVKRGAEICGESPEAWKRIARAAAAGWREAALGQLRHFVLDLS